MSNGIELAGGLQNTSAIQFNSDSPTSINGRKRKRGSEMNAIKKELMLARLENEKKKSRLYDEALKKCSDQSEDREKLLEFVDEDMFEQ